MQSSQIPVKFQIPFANSAGGSYTRPVPTASQIGIVPFAASLTDGFPPQCFSPGGAPEGQDFNGLLNQMSAWLRWAQAGAPVTYDATFSAAIGGYPIGALLQKAGTPGAFWYSTVENNTSNPDTGGANWSTFASGGGGGSSNANGPYYGVDTGAANAMVATVSPTFASFADGQIFEITPAATNTSTTPTINITPTGGSPLGVKQIIHSDGSAVLPGEISVGSKILMAYDSGSAKIVLLGMTPVRATASAQSGGTNWIVTGAFGGTANVLTGSLSPAPVGGVTAGLCAQGLISTPNTGPANLTLNGYGPYSIVRDDGSALIGGELVGRKSFQFDGSYWRVEVPAIATTTTQGEGRTISNSEIIAGASNSAVGPLPAWMTIEAVKAMLALAGGAIPIGACLTATAITWASTGPSPDTIGATATSTVGTVSTVHTTITSNGTLMPAGQVWTVVSSTVAQIENWNSNGSGQYPWLTTTNIIRTA